MPKSLFEYVADAIDEVLPPNSGLTGREIYLRGFERFEREHFEHTMAQKKREFDRHFPLLAPSSEYVENWDDDRMEPSAKWGHNRKQTPGQGATLVI